MTNLDSILKSRDIILLTKVHKVKDNVFPVVMYWCESWTIKKAEDQKIDAFELWCWRRLLRVLWTARRSNQSILKEISPEYLLEGLMLKVRLQYIGHLMPRTDSLEDPDAGKDWRQQEGTTEDEMVVWHHQLNGHEYEQTLGVDDGQGSLACCSPWGRTESDTTEQLNWTELGLHCCMQVFSSFRERGICSSCGAWASPLWWLLSLLSTGSRHTGFRSHTQGQ